MKKIMVLLLALISVFTLIYAVSENINISPDVTLPELPPENSTLILTKTVNGTLWRIRCDYMDGNYTIFAGGGTWKRDWIMNPEGSTGAEGHRSHKCGNSNNWVIWTDLDGNPYRMDEIKSGATGGTLPTVIFKTLYEMSTDEIMDIGNPEHPEYLEHFKSNFQETMEYSEIEIGKRLYWITWNGNQKWYHTGIPYEVTQPSFLILIDGQEYMLSSGESVELSDLEPGIHTISEEENPLYALGKVIISEGGTVVTENGWTITVSIGEGQNIEIEWPNQQPGPTKTSPPPPPPETIEPSPSPTPTPTPVPSSTPTPTPEMTPEPAITPTPTPTITPTPKPTATPTSIPTEWIPPEIPEDQPQPKLPTRTWYPIKLLDIDEYATALGLQLTINHVGDCFE